MSSPSAPGKPSNWNVPNVLTGLRIVMVPLFAWALLGHATNASWRWIADVVFILAILTDMADGKIARKYNLITDFGKLWDPIADKALTGMGFIALSILGELPWWITAIILLREWGITILRFWLTKFGTVMAANKGGKLKTVTQSVALAMFIPGLQFMPAAWGWVAWAFMIAAFLRTIYTGIDYLRAAQKTRAAYYAEHPEARR